MTSQIHAQIESLDSRLRGMLAELNSLRADAKGETEEAAKAERGRWTAVATVCAHHFGATLGELLSGRKYKSAVHARWATALVLYRCKLTYSAIGRLLKTDHSTAIHAVKNAVLREANEPHFAEAIVAGVAAWEGAEV